MAGIGTGVCRVGPAASTVHPIPAARRLQPPHHVVAGGEALDHRLDCCQPACECDPVGAAFESCDFLFERHRCGVLHARVVVPLFRLGDIRLDVRGGLEDGRNDCARRRFGLLSGVYGEGSEAGGVL